jgi:hypothetical protein
MLHCGNATINSLFIVVSIKVDVNNINVFSVAMQMQQWVLFALLLCYQIFHTAVNSNKY